MSEAVPILERPALPTVVALLEAAHLPTVDLSDRQLEHFFLAGSPEHPSGVIGLELYNHDALLRSLVVIDGARNQGLGAALVRHAEHYAARQGAKALYLLTTTAEHFFQRLGYARADRSSAPASITHTSQFSSLCPASSAFMVKSLVGVVR